MIPTALASGPEKCEVLQKNSVILCHLNAQSLSNKIDEIQATVLNAQQPTVLGVSETWLDKSVHDGEVDVSTSIPT